MLGINTFLRLKESGVYTSAHQIDIQNASINHPEPPLLSGLRLRPTFSADINVATKALVLISFAHHYRVVMA